MIYKIGDIECHVMQWDPQWHELFHVESEEVPRWLWLRLVPGDVLMEIEHDLWACEFPNDYNNRNEIVSALQAELARREREK